VPFAIEDHYEVVVGILVGVVVEILLRVFGRQAVRVIVGVVPVRRIPGYRVDRCDDGRDRALHPGDVGIGEIGLQRLESREDQRPLNEVGEPEVAHDQAEQDEQNLGAQ
jgi:hypothetical protein